MVKNQRVFVGMEGVFEIGKPAILWLNDGTKVKTSSVQEWMETAAMIKVCTKNSIYIMIKNY